jgi:two-component system response regulator DesR
MLRVLVVDDNALMRQALGQLLDAEPDLEVVAQCRDGDEVLDRLRVFGADVIVMDLSMERVDGVTATRLVASHAPGVRVLLLTASVDRARISEAMRAGAVAHVRKNADSEALLRAVRRAGEPDRPTFGESLTRCPQG